MVRWETEQPFDGHLCLEYVYQKLLKLDNPFSSDGKKSFGVFFMPHSVVLSTSNIHVNVMSYKCFISNINHFCC